MTELPKQPRSTGYSVSILRCFFTALVLIAPIKFGNSVVTTEIPLFPGSVYEWVADPWPGWVASVLAGCGLIAVLAVHRSFPRFDLRMLFPLSWCLLFAAALPGLIRTEEKDMAQVYVFHFAGVAAFSFSVFLLIRKDPEAVKWLLFGVVIGLVVSSLMGWYQVFWGFDKTARELAESGQRMMGVNMKTIQSNLEQGRAHGTFVYPNSLAAHMVLVTPIALLACIRFGGRMDPPLQSRIFLATLCVVLGVGALLLSRSRAGIAAGGAGFAGALLVFPALAKKHRISLFVLALLAGGLLCYAVNRGRGLGSLDQRFHYYRAAFEMFAEHPMTGVGLGEFFPHYLKIKGADAEVTRIPHNMFLNLLSQAGVVAGIAVLFCFALSLLAGFVLKKTEGECDKAILFCVQAGLFGWFLHAMLDFNVMIPGTLMTASILPCFLMNGKSEYPSRKPVVPLIMCALLALVCLLSVTRWKGEFAYLDLYSRCMRNQSTPTLKRSAQRVANSLPEFPYGWVILAKVAESRGQYEEAIDALKKAIDAVPHRGSLYAALAVNALKAGNEKLAEEALETARKLSPHDKLLKELYRSNSSAASTAASE